MNSLLLQRKHLPVKLVFLGPATIGEGPTTTALLVLSFHSRNAAASNLNFTDTLHARSGRLEHLPSAQWRVLLLVSGKRVLGIGCTYTKTIQSPKQEQEQEEMEEKGFRGVD